MAFKKISEVIEVRVEGGDQANRQLKQVDTAQDAAANSANRLESGQKRLARGARQTGRDQTKLARDTDRVSKSQRRNARATERSVQGFSRLQRQLISASNTMQGFSAIMRAGSIAVGMIKAPVDLAVGFERQFALIKTLNDDVGGELRTGLLDLAKRLPFSAASVSRAAYDAISSGIDPKNIVSFLEAAANSAIGVGGQLTSTVNVLTAAVNAYRQQGETAASIADKVQTTIKKAVINGEQMAAIMGQMTSAASLGVRFGEIQSAVGALTLIGVKPHQAIVRVNAAIKELTATQGHAYEQFKRLGIVTGVARIQAEGLTPILKEIQLKTGGSAEELKKLSNNVRAADGFIGLLGKNFKNYSMILDANNNSTGAAAKAAAILADTADGAIKRFSSAYENVRRKLGEQLLPVIVEVLEKSIAWMEKNETLLTTKFKDALDGFISFGRFMLAHGETIMRLMIGMFSGAMVARFAAGIAAVRAQMAAMSGSAMLAGMGAVLRSPGTLGLLGAAAYPLAKGLGRYIGRLMSEEIVERGRLAMQEMEAAVKKLNLSLKNRGYTSFEQHASIQRRLQSGQLLSRDLSTTGSGQIDAPIHTDNLVDLSKARKMKKGDLAALMEQNLRIRRLALQNAAKNAAELGLQIQQRKDSLAKAQKNLSPEAKKFMRSGWTFGHAFTLASTKKRIKAEINALRMAELRQKEAQDNYDAAKARIQELKKGSDALRKKFGQIEVDRDKKRAARAKYLSKQEEKRRKKIAKLNLRNQRRLDVEAIRHVGDDKVKAQADRELATLRLKHKIELEETKKQGLRIATVRARQILEERRLVKKWAKRLTPNISIKPGENIETQKRLAMLRGDKNKVATLDLDTQYTNDLMLFQKHGQSTLELERLYANERIRIRQRMAAAQSAIEMQLGANISSSLQTTIGAVKTVAEAMGASQDVIGGLEAAMIMSRAAFHTFMGFSELANAASAMAGAGPFGLPNPLKATAHKFAAASHFASAGMATVQAGAALVGSGGGGGAGGGSVSGAQTPTNASVQRSRSALSAERERPSVVFGDIVLADVPALLSREGAKALGSKIAGTVAQELGRRSNIQGTARLPRRAMR